MCLIYMNPKYQHKISWSHRIVIEEYVNMIFLMLLFNISYILLNGE
jgi:hypothetical protein